ncbi:hypothetical protein BD769DRAFT_1384614 [Suillus cothurnatus]|nr:hypothetical protein BD769DRAFT_1384614 [Suillus cothurnatus]
MQLSVIKRKRRHREDSDMRLNAIRHKMHERTKTRPGVKRNAGAVHSMSLQAQERRALSAKRGKVRARARRENTRIHEAQEVAQVQGMKARDSARVQGARMCACARCGNTCVESLNSQGAGSARMHATLYAYISCMTRESEMKERWTKPRVKYKISYETAKVEGAPMGGAVRSVEALYKLVGCVRCARLGEISREFDYIGQTREEWPFLWKCVQMLCKWAVRVVYQGAIGA